LTTSKPLSNQAAPAVIKEVKEIDVSEDHTEEDDESIS